MHPGRRSTSTAAPKAPTTNATTTNATTTNALAIKAPTTNATTTNAPATGFAGKGKQFIPFKKALLYARNLKLNNEKEWKAWCKSGDRPTNIPSNPHTTYKHAGWQGHGHWLGTGNLHTKEFLPFKEALLYARSLKLKGRKEWRLLSKSGAWPANVPSHPESTYKRDGWEGYGHWLGTGTVAHKDMQVLSFKKALQHARSLKLKSQKEWTAWCKSDARPANIPSRPDRVYKGDGWQGCGHWLGTGKVAHKDQQFLPFKEALRYAHSLNVKSEKGWRAWSKSSARTTDIPSHPETVYRNEGWKGYGHWLGMRKQTNN